jgi:hypothetical protein
MDFLSHLFIPRHTNNFRAKILHHSHISFLILIVSLFSLSVFLIKNTNPSVLGISYSINEAELLNYTNNARVQNGGTALELNEKLSDAARRKAANMLENDYWAHFAPDGTTPWSFIKAAGYEYGYAGENLAKGFVNSQDVVSAWMDSPSHRENLLSSKYKDIGFAIVEGKLQGEDTVLVVEMLGVSSGDKATVPESAYQAVSSEKEPVKNSEQKVSGTSYYPEGKNTLINSYSLTKSVSMVFLIFVITVLSLDLIIVERKKVPRIVGHNIDHIILIVLFLIFILLETNRGIL